MKKRIQDRIKKWIALMLIGVMALQLIGTIPISKVHAELVTEGENMFRILNGENRTVTSSNIYEGETITLQATSGTANQLKWTCSDMDKTYTAWSDENKRAFVLTAEHGTETGVPVTVSLENTSSGEIGSVTFYILTNNEFYLMNENGRIMDDQLEVSVGGSITIWNNKYNDPKANSISAQNSNGFITMSSSGDGKYKITNDKETQKTNASTNPVVISTSCSFPDEDGNWHFIMISKNLFVVDTLLLSDERIIMKKGIDAAHPGVTNVTANATNKTTPITWKVYQGELATGETNSATEIDKKLISVETTSSTGRLQDLATISVSSDLHLSTIASERIYTVVASQQIEETTGTRFITDLCYLILEQPVTNLSLSRHEVTMYLTSETNVVSTTIVATISGDGDVTPANTTINWSSPSDPSVISASRSTGTSNTFTALKPGRCVVVASSVDNPAASDVVYIEVLPKVTSVDITDESMTVNLSDKYVQLFANVQSAIVDSFKGTDEYEDYLNELNTTVLWQSSNEGVATVDLYNGKVTLVGAGQTTIMATSADDAKVFDSIVITVNVPVVTINLNKTSMEIEVGKSDTIIAEPLSNDLSIKPSNTTVTFESLDTKVAMVDVNGKVTGIAGGTATILIRADDGEITTTCTVTVYQAVSRIDISETELELERGSEAVLEAQVFPNTASNQKVNWSSNKPDVVSVDEDGVLHANEVGDAVVITASIENNSGETVTARCIVTVVVPITSLTLSPEEATLRKGETVSISHEIKPADATKSKLYYASTDTAVATVSDDGVIQAVAGGTCYITVRANSRDRIASVFVTVNEPVRQIVLDTTSVIMKKKSKFTLHTTVLNSTATNKDIIFSSSNSKVASVNGDTGLVKAKNYGNCVITARAMDGSGVKAICKVQVRRYVKRIKLSQKKLTMKINSKQTLVASVVPGDASKKKLEWYSSNDEVATVNSKGRITAQGIGRCTITCRATDGSNKKVKCKVRVKQNLDGNDLTGTKIK